jgi:hypothetical protein
MQSTNGLLPDANPDRQSVISPAVALGGEFPMHTLGAEEIAVTCQTEKVVGKRLIAKLSSSLPAGTGVRIDCDDAFIIGEVLGCWREGQTTFTAIELQHQLAGLAEFAALNEELFGSDARVVEYAARRNS